MAPGMHTEQRLDPPALAQVARDSGRLDEASGAWEIGRLMVAPDLSGRGLGTWLLGHAEAVAPAGATSYALLTGAGSARNLRLYRKAGYRAHASVSPGVVRLTKPRRATR